MRILITGSNGLLGQKIVGQLNESNIDFLASSKGENRNSKCHSSNYSSLDITSQNEVNTLIDEYQPTCVINTAAMTNVDACEENEEGCREINVEAVSYLFNKCKAKDVHFVHLSTDFVFDGAQGPYSEEDERNPLSIYAKSKVQSEDILINSDYKNWSILRTIIVFGIGERMSRSNIILWARETLQKGGEMTIVNDQFRAPTWADDLAWACIETCKRNAKGVFHISGPETFSIFQLVTRMAEFYQLDTSLIKPISSESLNQKAKRPPKTGFILNKASKYLDYQPMKLEESLKYLENELR